MDNKDRPSPKTHSGEEWRRAEALARKLEETGDTPTSFLVKGATGCAVPTAIGVLVLWLLYRGIRALFG